MTECLGRNNRLIGLFLHYFALTFCMEDSAENTSEWLANDIIVYSTYYNSSVKNAESVEN